MSTDTILDQPPVVSGHWKTVLMIFIIFVFGCFSGSLSTTLIDNHRMADTLLRGKSPVSDLLEKRLMRDIALDAGQRQAVRDLLDANGVQREQLQGQLHPQIQQLDRATTSKIDALLQPDQRDQFHHNITLLDQRYGHNLFDPGAPAPSAP